MRDRYEGYVACSTRKERVFSFSDSIEEHINKYGKSSSSRTFEGITEALVWSGKGQDCRELLLSYMHSDTKFMLVHKSHLKPQMFYVRISEDTRGTKLYSHTQENLEVLASVLNAGNFRKYNLGIEYDYGVLSVDVMDGQETYSRVLATVSMLLWIIRRNEILKWCADYIRENSPSRGKLFLELSSQFLFNKGWGTSDNENAALSVFCYFESTGHIPVHTIYSSSGPEDFAQNNVSSTTLVAYVKDIVLPFLKAKKIEVTPKRRLESMLPIHDDLSSNFATTLRSLIISEGM